MTALMPSSRRSHRIARAPTAWVPERNSKPVWTSSSCFRTHALLRLGASRARFNFYAEELKAPKRERKVMSQKKLKFTVDLRARSADTPSLSELHSPCDGCPDRPTATLISQLRFGCNCANWEAHRNSVGTTRIPGPFVVTLETNN